jgi:hypothetical protein
MTKKATVRHGPSSPPVRAPASPELLHRKCSCGATKTGGTCSKCQGDASPGAHAPLVQPKLTISQPDDIHEREADRVAAEIMTMPLPTSHRRSNVDIQKSEFGDHEQGQAAPQMSPDLSAQIASLRGGGTPLSREARAFMEPRFGYDFSQVRVHTGPRAAETAQALNARAFTLGHDIAFGSGEYSPGTDAGRRLLAHELMHVVQQGQAHIYADAQVSRAVQHEPTRAVTDTARPAQQHKQQFFYEVYQCLKQTNPALNCEWKLKEPPRYGDNRESLEEDRLMYIRNNCSRAIFGKEAREEVICELAGDSRDASSIYGKGKMWTNIKITKVNLAQ